MQTNGQTHALRIAFRSLDVESKSKAVPLVLCPKRAAALTAETCGRCKHFRRIELDGQGLPLLRCVPSQASVAPHAAAPERSVQEVLRVPPVCACLDTSIAKLMCVLGAQPADLIPVLDTRRKPRGYVTSELIEELLLSGVPGERRLGEVMLPFLTRVQPGLSLAEAARLIACSCSGYLTVTDADGALLGVVSAQDVVDASALA